MYPQTYPHQTILLSAFCPSTSSVVALLKSTSPSYSNSQTSIISLKIFPSMIFRVFVKRTCPFSGIKSTPTSSFASRIAPNKLSSPFTTEPPTHYHIKGYVGLFAERCEIRYSPLELRIQTCTTRWYPSIGSCSPLTWSFP